MCSVISVSICNLSLRILYWYSLFHQYCLSSLMRKFLGLCTIVHALKHSSQLNKDNLHLSDLSDRVQYTQHSYCSIKFATESGTQRIFLSCQRFGARA